MNQQERLLIIFKEVFGSDLILTNELFKYQGEWDSLRHAELVLRFQKEFKRKLSWSEIDKINKFEDFLDLIEK